MTEKILKLLKKYEEIFVYLIVGGLTTVVSLLTYYLSVFFIFDPHDAIELQYANVISWICSVTFAYFGNRIFVFKSDTKMIYREILNFYLARISTLVLDMGFMYVFSTWLGFDDKIVKLFVQVIIVVFNYILSKFVVFGMIKSNKT